MALPCLFMAYMIYSCSCVTLPFVSLRSSGHDRLHLALPHPLGGWSLHSLLQSFRSCSCIDQKLMGEDISWGAGVEILASLSPRTDHRHPHLLRTPIPARSSHVRTRSFYPHPLLGQRDRFRGKSWRESHLREPGLTILLISPPFFPAEKKPLYKKYIYYHLLLLSAYSLPRQHFDSSER